MKRTALWVLVCAGLIVAMTARQRAQEDDNALLNVLSAPDYLVNHPVDVAQAMNDAALSNTIPLWQYQLTSPVDGKTYTGTMVGRSPFNRGARTTTIPVRLIPIRFTLLSDTATPVVFDPTAPNAACYPSNATALTQQSPVFQSAPFTLNGTFVGNTQYIDAFRREEFWTNVQPTGNAYHMMLSLQTDGVIDVFASQAVSFVNGSGCGVLGRIDIDAWDNFVNSVLLPSLGASPTTLPLFLFHNVVMYINTPGNCCVLGYHSLTGGSPVQTYGNADFDTSHRFVNPGIVDTSILVHEVAEWADDPLVTSPTPAWGHIGQVAGCQDNLEVGDPLTGTNIPVVTMPNGFGYHLQELVNFDWFYRTPSKGTGGKFSSNGTFTSDAGPVCH